MTRRLLDGLSGCGLAHAELIGQIVEAARAGQLQDSEGHSILWSECGCLVMFWNMMWGTTLATMSVMVGQNMQKV